MMPSHRSLRVAALQPSVRFTLDPDVVVFAWCGAGDRVPPGRVFCIPDEILNIPAPTGAIHPQIFGAAENLRSLQTDGLERATSKII